MSLERVLAHPDIVRLVQGLARTPGVEVADEPGRIWAAIAMIMRLSDAGEPEMLMIKRAEYPGDPWSGHVAVPGGRRDPGDANLAATAIRETREETGVDLSAVGRALGTLDDVAPRTPYLPPISIRPFIFAAAGALDVTPSSEVAKWFWVPLSAIRDEAAWSVSTVLMRGMPSQERTFTFGEHVVWGLTERVLRRLTEVLGNTAKA